MNIRSIKMLKLKVIDIKFYVIFGVYMFSNKVSHIIKSLWQLKEDLISTS